MGNKIARTTQASASEYYLHDLPSSYNLVLKEVLGRGRFFKSILCKHDEGLVLVKVYFKRGDYIDLREYERRLFEIKETFKNVHHSHVWPFQYWLETDKAAYLLRQYFFNNLLDRLSTRPFLSNVEKKWIAFQLLHAVKQSHDSGVCHGDIKCENVVVTSWNWVYLADFASFKPTYIPDDDPSDFSFYFDTGGRRRCYLAPERFHEPGGEVQYASDAPLEPSMDIFSLGCVLAELFLEGQPLFELSQLLSYRRGQYDPGQLLEKIPDPGIRKMILHMIQLDPELRLSAESYLQDYTPSVFPTYFSPFLHKFFSCLSPLDSDTRVAVTQGAFNEILKQMLKGNEDLVTNSDTVNGSSLMNVDNGEQNLNMEKISSNDRIKLDKGHLAGELASLLAGVEKSTGSSYTSNKFAALPDCAQHAQHPEDDLRKPSKKPTNAISTDFLFKSSTPFRRISKNELYLLVSNYDNQLDTFGIALFPESENNLSCEGMVLIAALLCSCLRSVKLPQLRRAAILLLRSASFYIDDEDRLQHVIPYVIAMLSDSTAIVRCAAIDTLCDVLPLIQDFPPSDAKIFPEYILPMLSTLPDDTEESVRICYASNIFKIALTAYRFLVHSQKLSEAGILDKASSPKKSAAHLQLSQLRKSIAEVVQELVMGPKQTLNIRRALLQDIVYLCCFFGQRQCNDFLLPILPAFLNDRDEQLKALFYDEIVFVCFSVGQRSVEEYLLPYIDQALSETAEPVIVNALECLVLLCRNGFLRKSVLLDMIKQAFPLLCHPSHWVRRLAVRLITTSSEKLGPVDSYVYLSPVLRTFLRREPSSLSLEESLLSCLKPPVSRQVFYQVLETARSSDMLERQRKIWYSSSAYSKQLETIDLNQKAGEGLNARVELDDASKFRAKGSFARTSASGMDVRDPLCSDKLQFSGFISPHVSAGNSLICDGPSEGIPLYSLSIDRRNSGAGTTQSSSLSQWNTVGSGASSMPWIDPSNKSFTLAGSTSPKLVSGSFFSINNGSKPVYKVVQDAQVKESDQIDLTTSKLNDVNISVAANGSSSISIEDAATFPEVSGVASLSRGTIVPDPGWRPRGVLVAHLQEHRSAVNDIAVSNDHSFFVSASDDSTVKIWDTRKLEKDISFRSRLTYPLDSTRALCVTLLRGSSQVVVGSSDGSIHMFSVDYISKGLGNVVERYSGIADIKRKEVGEGPILSLMNYSLDGIASNSILYSTRSSQVHLWDLRTNSITWTLKSNPEEGFVTSFVTGPCGNWLVSGSSRGVLTLWDLRFLIPVNTWQFSVATPVEKMCLFIPHALGPTSSPLRPLVYVAAGRDELSLWNAENGSCYQVLKAADTGGSAEINDIPWALARSSTKSNSKQVPKSNINLKYRVDELNAPPSRLPGIRSLLPLPGGDLLSGGTDMRIRRWDHSSPDKSYCVCGPSIKDMGKDEVYVTKNSFGIQVVQEIPRGPGGNKLTMKAIHTAAATDSAGCHRDAILSISSAKLNQRLLISSSRDGAIKVWK